LEGRSVTRLPGSYERAPSNREADLVENQGPVLHGQLKLGEARADQSGKLENAITRDSQLARWKISKKNELVDRWNVEGMSECYEHSLPDFDGSPIDCPPRKESMTRRTEHQEIVSIVASAFRDLDDVMKVEREDAPTCRDGAAVTCFGKNSDSDGLRNCGAR
jgi:hypothetical protein